MRKLVISALISSGKFAIVRSRRDPPMNKNICRFVPYHSDYHSIHTINFVLETETQPLLPLRSQAVYKMHYVCTGSGKLHTLGKVQDLMPGDIFFTFPASPFCIESGQDLTYMYISFLGFRGNMIMEQLQISPSNFLFRGNEDIQTFWEKALEIPSDMTDLISESILLYTFAHLGRNGASTSQKASPGTDTALYIKKYIDDHFADPTLSLEQISTNLSYNKKYVSTIFKKQLGISLVEYLNTVRIQNACTLIKQGFTSVSDIANCCGYSDPQYFSKVFKKKLEVSPVAYIQLSKTD